MFPPQSAIYSHTVQALVVEIPVPELLKYKEKVLSRKLCFILQYKCTSLPFSVSQSAVLSRDNPEVSEIVPMPQGPAPDAGPPAWPLKEQPPPAPVRRSG